MTIYILSVSPRAAAKVHPFRTAPRAAAHSGRLHIGFLTPHDSTDRRAFSGTTFLAVCALEARTGLSVTRFGAPPRRSLVDRMRRRQPAPAPSSTEAIRRCGYWGFSTRMLLAMPHGCPRPMLGRI